MSYQANYNTQINTRIASDALKRIGKNFLQMSENIRVGSVKCSLAMDNLMKKNNGFLVDINELKTSFENQYKLTMIKSPELSLSQAKLKTINSVPELKVFAEMSKNFKTLNDTPELVKGREGKINVEAIVEESFSLIEKSFVDIQTVLVTKAITKCNWSIVDSASEKCAQTIVAQNDAGSVLALNITSNNVSLDLAGLCDSTCVDHANKLISELDKVGLKAKLTNDFKHNKPSGGILLGASKDAEKIIKKINKKNRKTLKFTIPVQITLPENNIIKSNDKIKIKDL